METVTIRTLSEFTDLVEGRYSSRSDVLFRGQVGDFPLLPSIARERLTGPVLEAERSMIEEFRRHCPPHLRVVPSTLWDWLALAQHHGLPTRLLDWSHNPLTSLWFAVRAPAPEGMDGYLWMFRPDPEDFARDDEKGSLECRRNSVFAPMHVSERITAQVAWFTVHRAWPEEPEFAPLEDSPEFSRKLTKIVLPADRFADLRLRLDLFGINHASVFPGLDGLCAHIKWKRCILPDERDRRRAGSGSGP
jgi:hypothetical protein